MKISNTILLIVAIFTAAVAMAVAPVERTELAPTDEWVSHDTDAYFENMRGHCVGIFVPFTSFSGAVYGDMVGTESTCYTFEYHPNLRMMKLVGRSTVTTEDGTLTFSDTIKFRPYIVPGLYSWTGVSEIVDGTGAFEGCFGTKTTDGCYVLASSQLWFNYNADVWTYHQTQR